MRSTVGRYRGCRFARCRVRVVFPHAEKNPLLWVAWTPDRTDVICWVDTKREMEAAVDEWLAVAKEDRAAGAGS